MSIIPADSISLKEDLRGIKTMEEAEAKLSSLISKDEKRFVKTQTELLSKYKKEMLVVGCSWSIMYERHFVLADKWARNPNPRVRALLEPSFGPWQHDLNVIVLLDLPIEALPFWTSIGAVLSRDADPTQEFLDLNWVKEKITFNSINYFWGEHNLKPTCPILLSGLIPTFVKNEDKPLLERLDLINKSLISGAIFSTNQIASQFLTLKDDIISKLRALNNLGDIPNSWVEEICLDSKQ